jgi:hypothetical protein
MLEEKRKDSCCGDGIEKDGFILPPTYIEN